MYNFKIKLEMWKWSTRNYEGKYTCMSIFV